MAGSCYCIREASVQICADLTMEVLHPSALSDCCTGLMHGYCYCSISFPSFCLLTQK